VEEQGWTGDPKLAKKPPINWEVPLSGKSQKNRRVVEAEAKKKKNLFLKKDCTRGKK